jgi:PhzF family phenazine biosynthesis protein
MVDLSLKYYVTDVFTDQPFQGNPLAVVFTPYDLSLGTYSDIAKEFGYSETSFLQFSEKDKSVKVRSFTPTGFEINGAGHNLLGAICSLLLKNHPFFQEKGKQAVVIMKDRPISIFMEGTHVGMKQVPAVIKQKVALGKIAEAISLPVEEVGYKNLMPTIVATEVSHLMVPIKDQESLDRARSRKDLLAVLANNHGFQGVYCFTIREDDPKFIATARFFNPGIGIDEDPATGSAAGPLGGFLHQKGHIDKNREYQILQGQKMDRPSVIKFNVGDDGVIIGGTAVITMEGTLYIRSEP